MTKRPGWRPTNVYLPETVDLTALRAELSRYMAGPRLAARSVAEYEWCLRRVEAWCTERQLQAFPLDPQVLGMWLAAALLGTARMASAAETTQDDNGDEPEPPAPLSMSTVDQTWAAVAWQHSSQRRPSPTDDPWVKTVRRGLRRALAGHRVRKAPPLSPDDVRALVSVEPTWSAVGIAERALLLAAVDLPVSLTDLSVVPPSALELLSPTQASFSCGADTYTIECAGEGDCDAGCLLCALWSCAQLLPSDAPYLFGVLPGAKGDVEDYPIRVAGDRRAQVTWARSVVESRAVRGRGCWPIAVRDGQVAMFDAVRADVRLAGGLRRGLALSASEDGLLLLQQRAGLLLSWHRGLRSDDMRRRHRGCLEHVEQGYRLTITSAKGTRATVVLGVRPAADPQLDPVAALDQWLPVLDAAAIGTVPAGEVPLVVRCPRGVNLTLEPVDYGWMWRHFADLQRRAGLSGFTLHSTRTGFAVTAANAEATPEQLRRVMRQKKVNVAVAYVLSRAARSRPAPLALAAAAGAAGAA